MKYSNLQFFNGDGNNCNFIYDQNLERWVGRIYLPKVSTGLFETTNLFILEKIDGDITQYTYPRINDGDTNTVTIALDLEGGSRAISMFQYNTESEEIEIERNDFIVANLDQPNSPINSVPLQLNIALNSEVEGIFERILYIIDDNDDHIIAEFLIYGETYGNDERLDVLTGNRGYNIKPVDIKLFKETDLNEDKVDYQLFNKKQKELLLEGHNIFPYRGTYKGLINAIKYFGYDNITVKEYWKNVNKESVDYGKFKHSKVIDIFDDNIDFNNSNLLLPNKHYRKANMLGLFYRLNEVIPGEDKFGIPKVQETFNFSPEEILIKLYGLKNKLQKDFLQDSSRIVDIVGEADYFGNQNISYNLIQNVTDRIDTNVTPNFKVYPSEGLYIQDLRTIEDLTLPDDNFSHDILEELNTTAEELNKVLLAYYKDYYPNLDTIEELPDKPGIPVGCPVILSNDSFDLTWDDMTLPWDYVQSNTGTIIDFHAENITEDDVFTITDNISGTNISYTALSGDTDLEIAKGLIIEWDSNLKNNITPWNKFRPSIELVDGDNVLRIQKVKTDNNNTSFKFDASAVNGIGNDLQEFKVYYPTTLGMYTWGDYDENLGVVNGGIINSNYYDIEWEITKEADYENGILVSNEFNYRKQGSLYEYGTLPIVLPYTGKYTVRMSLYDTFNQVSSVRREDFIEVNSKEVEFIGLYRALVDTPSIDDFTQSWDDTGSCWQFPSLENQATWDDCNVAWDGALNRANMLDNIPAYETELIPELDENGEILYHENGSIKYITAVKEIIPDNYNTHIMTYRDNGEVSYTGPYFWDNLFECTWDDADHLWWDAANVTGDIPAHFRIMSIKHNGYLRIIHAEGTGEYIFSTMDLKAEAEGLNNSTNPIISKYIYNVVKDEEGKAHFIQAVAKFNGTYGDYIKIEGKCFIDSVHNDQPASYDIIEIPENGTLIITKGDDEFIHTFTSTDWEDAKLELINTRVAFFKQFNYEVVTRDDDSKYIRVVGREAGKVDANIGTCEFDTISGTCVTTNVKNENPYVLKNSKTNNITFNELQLLTSHKILPKLIHITFTYEKCKIPGKQYPEWRIVNHSDFNSEDIYSNKQWFSYMFKNSGDYTIELSLRDSNGNRSTVARNILTIK